MNPVRPLFRRIIVYVYIYIYLCKQGVLILFEQTLTEMLQSKLFIPKNGS